MALQLKKPLAVIDLETTGTNLGSDRIIEIAIVKLLPDGSQVLKRKIINPQIPIPRSVTELHGITDEYSSAFSEPLGPKWKPEFNDGELVDQRRLASVGRGVVEMQNGCALCTQTAP